jgi:hypothetical protein
LSPPRWHDAGTYDATTKTGGANGSIRNEEELNHGANNGLKIAIALCGRSFFLVLALCLEHSIMLPTKIDFVGIRLVLILQ